MRIAIIALTDFDTSSSTVSRVKMIGNGLAKDKNEVHIIIPQRFKSGPLKEIQEELTIHWAFTTNTQNWKKLCSRINSRISALYIIKALSKEGLDWLILYNLGLEGFLYLLIARYYKVDVSAEFCDIRTRPKASYLTSYIRYFWHSISDFLVPRFTGLNISISTFLDSWLLNKAPKTPTLIIPPLVNTELFNVRISGALQFKNKWSIKDHQIIAYLGSYWNVEGISVLLKSIKALANDGIPFTLVISGSKVAGRTCDDVSKLIEEDDLKNLVIQTGWLSTTDVIDLMSLANILVVPKTDSSANIAGVATKLAEYLSMGKAVIASRIGDVSLYLKDGIDCLLCSPGSQPELTEALRRLLNDVTLQTQLGKKARETALQYFDYRTAGKKISLKMQQLRSK